MSSAILDQWGEPYVYNRRAARAADGNNGTRPYESVELKDIGQLVPSYDRRTILSASRKLYLNEPVLQGAVEQKAMYAVGRAWLPKFTGADVEFGKRATDWLINQWYPLCDIRGTDYDFTTGLFNTSIAMDRDGESWRLLTEDKTGFPRTQEIPAHRIGTPWGSYGSALTDGPYRGLEIEDGIIYNRIGQPVAVAYLDKNGKLSQWISARDIIHNFDPNWQEQGRGLPAFVASINAMRDSLQSHEWERHALLMMSAIGLIEKNETGSPDFGDPSANLTGANTATPCGTGVTTETFSGGMVKYFRANSGGGLETLKNDRPGTTWESFQDRIIRAALAGVNWPYALVWKATGQGTAERHEIAKAQRAIEDRQEVLKKGALATIGWAVAKAQKLGILPESADWWKWDFTYPTKLTIDDGRVGKELVEGWKAGYVNQTDILGAHGKTLKEHLYERAEEVAMRKVIAAEIGAKHKVIIEDREMAMLTPNEMAPQEAAPTKEDSNEA
jgi:hypothetical protein